MKDVKEIDAKYVKGLKFHYVNNMKDVLDIVLLKNNLNFDKLKKF